MVRVDDGLESTDRVRCLVQVTAEEGSKPFVVACIPAFNEELSIGSVIVRTLKHVDQVIVCDDGSMDLTGDIAGKMGVTVIRHERNLGYGAAIASLFEEARRIGSYVMVTLDADGQHNPDEISSLVEPILAGEADVVIGSRFLREGDSDLIPGYRKIGLRMITGLASGGSNGTITDSQSGFRAYSRKALDKLSLTEMGMGVSTEILLKVADNGLRVAEVPVRITYDENSSTHNPLVHGLDVVLSTVKLQEDQAVQRRPCPYCMSNAALWAVTFGTFTATRTISTNVTLVALGATIVGLMLMTTAIILWVIIGVIREIRG
ncbi:Undecaprenyl-phosphate 4-deoxy-4-formamido-L-arabinose transferase [subsurface metagenome]